jgi:AcrR family transcriptional regulator
MPESKKAAVRGRRPSSEPSGRGALLKAALSAFSKKGYEGTSLRLLASEAQVDMALVARLFGSKSMLWLAVIDDLSERQVSHLEKTKALAELSVHSPDQAFKEFVELFAQISFEIPEFPAFLLQEAASGGERLELLSTKLVKPFRLASAPILAATVSSGIVHIKDHDLLWGMLVSAIAVPMVCPRLFLQKRALTPKLRDAIAEQAVLMFCSSNSSQR